MLLYLNYPSWLKPELFPSIPWLSFLRWYSLAYILGFFIAYQIFIWLLNRNKETKPLLTNDEATDFGLLLMVFMILGGRIGYVLLYDPAYFFGSFQAFLSIFLPFSFGENGKDFTFTGISGLSYHGAVLGVILAMMWTAKKKKISFFKLSDSLLPAIALVYTLGRLGNFANQELYGKVTASPLGVLFPNADRVLISSEWGKKIAESAGMSSQLEGGLMPLLNLPRHASQLYESFFEGIVLGSILLLMALYGKKLLPGIISATYVFGYGLVRFFVEYIREPDPQLGFIIKMGPGADTPEVFTSLLNFSMGQLLCFLMVLASIGLYTYIILSHRRKPPV